MTTPIRIYATETWSLRVVEVNKLGISTMSKIISRISKTGKDRNEEGKTLGCHGLQQKDTWKEQGSGEDYAY